MALFEYLGVLISVVMGLAITHLLTGVTNMIHHRSSVRLSWPHLLWTLDILIYVIAVWWGMFWWSQLEAWGFFQFLFVTLYAIVLYLIAAILYPRNFDADFDAVRHFEASRGWFFGLMITAWFIDVPETLLKANIGLRDAPAGYFAFVGLMVTYGAIGIGFKNRVVQHALPVVWLATIISYLGMTTLSRIAS